MSEQPGAPSSRAAPAHRSPFTGHAAGEFATPAGRVGVRLRAATVPGAVLVATWPAGLAALDRALGAALGAGELAQRPGLASRRDDGLLLRTGPLEFLWLPDHGADPDPVAALRRHVTADVGSVTDLGHARCRIRVEGAQCRATLSKLFALDLREAAFAVGELRQSGHHHVPCTLLRLAPACFDLLVFSSYAFDQLATLKDAALEYGYALELPGLPLA